MKHAYTWGAILVIVVASVVGDVLLARAMKKVGDVGELRRRAGLGAEDGAVVRAQDVQPRPEIVGVAYGRNNAERSAEKGARHFRHQFLACVSREAEPAGEIARQP